MNNNYLKWPRVRENSVHSCVFQVVPSCYAPQTETENSPEASSRDPYFIWLRFGTQNKVKREVEMRRVSLISLFSIVVFATLFVAWALAQRPMRSAGSSDADTIPPLYLRTRIALPGVYGRMDHYGLDTKRDVLMVSKVYCTISVL